MARTETVEQTVGDETNATERTLIVLDSDTPGDTLRAALGIPGVAAAEPDLLLVYSDEEYEQRLAALKQTGYRGPYSVHQFAEAAKHVADRTGREWLSSGYGTTYGDVGRVDQCVAHAIDARGYTQVYALRPHRTLLGRLLRRLLFDRSVAGLPDTVELLTVSDHDRLDS